MMVRGNDGVDLLVGEARILMCLVDMAAIAEE
jgi:hypothetical protein